MAAAAAQCLLLLTASAAALVANPPKFPTGTDFSVRRIPMAEADEPADLRLTDNIVTLRRQNAVSLSSVYVQAMREQAWARTERDVRLGTGSVPLVSVEAGQVFLAPITVGAQDFYVVVDTGSSDPWLVETDFECFDPVSMDQINEEECYFATPYDRSASSTFERIPNENFNITYADGEYLNGDMGYESITLGGITVARQKFGLVDYAAWYGDGYSSGLVGFAYGTLTNAFPGEDPKADQRGGTLLYNPLFVSMYNQSLIAPLFSMAIDRDESTGGVLALGGIPSIPRGARFVSTPIRPVGVFVGTTTPAYEFYTVLSDGFAIAGDLSTQFNVVPDRDPRKQNLLANDTVIVDSGTSLLYAPNAVADRTAELFQPPAVFDADRSAYFVDCDAVPPVFGVSIAEKIFWVNGKDLIVRANGGRCIMGVQPNYGGLTILGDVWMKNVLCVFDVGAAQMRFAARQFYGLSENAIVPAT